MLYDKEFLRKLDKNRNKTIYARITALKFNETPVEMIEGRVTGGSINIDGASSLRRSCSLTMVAQEFNYNDYYWGLNTKFKLQIGIKNNVDSSMPDIIWFDQGIYLISSFNTSRSATNFTISISGKDKMCLLNGEVGGALESSVDFGTIEEEDKNGVWTIRKIPIQDIIRNAVHTYAGEPYWNIIINDLDTYGLELLEYRYDTPMYLYRDAEGEEDDIFHNIIMENNTTRVKLNRDDEESVLLAEIPPSHLDTMVESLTGTGSSPLPVYFNDKAYIFAKVEYGQTVGYRITDLTYPGDLIANVGEAITSVLDKIKNMLTEFEYFYDLNGSFVFQKKKSFTSTLWTPLQEDVDGNGYIAESLALSSSTAYTFSGSELITAFNNNPNLLNMRNDYSIWGQRTGSSGAAIPVHMRYAIDSKPNSYTQIAITSDEDKLAIENYNARYGTTLAARAAADAKTFIADTSDWREVIYQMGLDYYKYNMLDNFELLVAAANPQYPTGQTGYERYYTDLQGFWRQLYNPDLQKKIDQTTLDLETAKNTVNGLKEKIATATDPIELDNDRKNLRSWEIEVDNLTIQLEGYQVDIENYYYEVPEGDEEKMFWNKNVFEHPHMLNFWFDFLDTEGELQQFNVKNVGSRSKPVNDTNVKSIYFRETPAVVFTDDLSKDYQSGAYRFIQIPKNQMESMFSISAQGKSAKDRLDELIYQHGYCIESATITAIPIYYLEPNVRIYVHDEDTGVDGEYVVSKITLPLAYNGTMSITATKAAENVL